MKWDISICIVVMLISIVIISAGAMADDSNEREVGGWSLDKYHGYENDLCAANANVDQFYNKMGQYGWTKMVRWKDDDAWESDFEDHERGGRDKWEADSVDLVYFCGHGNPWGIAFGTNHDGVPGGSNYFAENVEIKWGDVDMEWIILDSCQVLQYKANNQYCWQRWDNPSTYPYGSALTIHAGLHGIIGWHSVAVVYNCWNYGFESRGGLFADRINDHYNVWGSWNRATKQAKPWWDGTTYKAAIFYGKIYSGDTEILRYSNEDFWNPWKDPVWYKDHGYTIKLGYSSWNV